MPHIKMEVSDNIEISNAKSVFLALQKILHDCADVPAQNCKSRLYVATNFLVGDEKTPAFTHLEIALLEGRSSQVKSQIGEKALQILNNTFASDTLGTQITVEIRDIHTPQYFKKVSYAK